MGERRRETQPEAVDTPVVPERIYAQVSPRSVGGVSLFEVEAQISAETVVNFFSGCE